MKHFVIGLNLIRKYQKYLWVMDGKLKKNYKMEKNRIGSHLKIFSPICTVYWTVQRTSLNRVNQVRFPGKSAKQVKWKFK